MLDWRRIKESLESLKLKFSKTTAILVRNVYKIVYIKKEVRMSMGESVGIRQIKRKITTLKVRKKCSMQRTRKLRKDILERIRFLMSRKYVEGD